ncbi:MAG: hypothetical protein R3C45_18420 [Phycisphaerales bacterium]
MSSDAATRCSHRRSTFVAGSGEDRIEIGTAAAYMNGEPAYAGGDIVIVSPTETNSVFLVYFVGQQRCSPRLYRRAQGTGGASHMRGCRRLELRCHRSKSRTASPRCCAAADREIAPAGEKLAAPTNSNASDATLLDCRTLPWLNINGDMKRCRRIDIQLPVVNKQHEVLEQLGEGGMGCVVKVRRQKDGKELALILPSS